MFCRICGKKMANSIKFCGNCGTKTNFVEKKKLAENKKKDVKTFDKKPEQRSYSREFTIPGCFTYKSLFSGDADTGNYGVVCVIE